MKLDVIYNEDCLEGMKRLSDESIDLIATSPPFNCRKNYGNFNDEMPWSEYYIWMGKVLTECYRLLCPGGTIAINIPGVIRYQHDHKYRNTWQDFDSEYKCHRGNEKILGRGKVEPVGFKVYEMMFEHDKHIREPIIWVKGSREGEAICSRYAMGSDNNPYMRPAHELILLGSKLRWFHRGGTGRRGAKAVPFIDYTKDVWHITPVSDKHHPAIWPEEIPTRLIRLFVHAKNAVILDPFFGLGNTGLACRRLEYHYIGFEINPEYCKIARKRLAQVQLELIK